MFANATIGTRIAARLLGALAFACALVVAAPVLLVFLAFFIA